MSLNQCIELLIEHSLKFFIQKHIVEDEIIKKSKISEFSLQVGLRRFPERDVYFGKRRFVENLVGHFFGHHNDSSVEISIDNTWHNGSIDNSQVIKAHHFAVRIDHGIFVTGTAHFSGSTRVISCF